MFYSTRDSKLRVTASKAILKGLSDDGGLFLPETIPSIDISKLLNLSYQELACYVLSLYLDDFTKDEIESCVKKAYGTFNFPDGPIQLHHEEKFSVLELFHGPTTTFKDMALSLLPHLMSVAKKKNGITKKIQIVTATSGDTGSAALSSFISSDDISVKVLYPHGGISAFQEMQMLYFTSDKCRAYALDESNFDDCQNFVKKILNEQHEDVIVSSANSINIGRLVPQIVYYIKSYIDLVNAGKINLGDELDVVVPTGNFGNIFASYLAKKMGTPLGKIVCASNENRVLTDFLTTGTYSIDREFKKTNSPSMDILISSNLERLLYLLAENDEEVRSYMKDLKSNKKGYKVSDSMKKKLNEFEAYSVNEKDTIEAIRECFDTYNYLIDPHTAVSYRAYTRMATSNRVLVVSTASPYKFTEAILEVFNKKEDDVVKAMTMIQDLTGTKMPVQLEKVLKVTTPRYLLKKSQVEDVLFSKKELTVSVPATSANLGPCFDVAGIALNLFNKFGFKPNANDVVKGFKSEYKDNNLVLKSYRRLFERYGDAYLPVEITLLETNVPESRGLGSSSTCIVAGLMAANEMLNRKYSKLQLLELATELEGHPDNAAPAIFGSLVAAWNDGNEYHPVQYVVSDKLKFILAVPDVQLKTKDSRGVLPQSLSYKDIQFNSSRIMNMAKAYMEGDVKSLCGLIEDKIHTPYRLKLIPDADKIGALAKANGCPFTISGSGSTLLIISSDESIISKLEKEDYSVKYRFMCLSVNKDGATVEEK